MVTAKRKLNREEVKGYYFFGRNVDSNGVHTMDYVMPDYADILFGVQIDLDTVEPVAVPVEKESGIPSCPNCGWFLDGPSYCPECGQRLDWGDMSE